MAKTNEIAINDPDYFVKKKLELDAKKIEMDAKNAYEFTMKQAKMELDFAQKHAALKLMEMRSVRTTRGTSAVSID